MSLNVAHFALAHVAVTAALAGVIWTVQLAVYPQFGSVSVECFRAFHRHYVRGISWLVTPLMGAEVLTAAALLWWGVRGPVFLGSLVLIAMIWAITFAVELPLHRKLATGFDPAAQRNLVWANWARTLAWTARTLMVSWWLYGLSGW
jgi:hypothetical protein